MRNFAICLLLLFSIAAKAQTVITIKHGTENVSTSIGIYKDGERVANFYSGSNVSLTDLPVGVYTYKTGTNHSGTIDTGKSYATLELNCAKLEVQIVDAQNKPISGTDFKIYEDGNEIQSQYTDDEGKCTFYLKPSLKYAYTNKYCSGGIEIPEDKANGTVYLNLNRNRLQITAKYKDIPINGSFTLYPYNDKEHPASSDAYTSSTSGKMTFNVAAGEKYWIKTKYGTFSQPYTLTSENSTFYLEHYKVTFISNATTPNVLKELKVGEGYSSSSESKTTDGKGYAVFYLIPGTYSYSHLNGSGSFTVENADKTIDITSRKQTITFTNLSGKPHKNLHLQAKDKKDSYTGLTVDYVTDGNGRVCIERTGNSCLYLNIEDDISSLPLYAVQDTTIQLVTCSFKSALSDNDYINIQGNGVTTRINSGESGLLLQGKYSYSHLHENEVINQNNFIAESDVYINEELKKVTVHGHYKDGSTLDGSNYIQIYRDGVLQMIKSLDGNGQCVFHISSGTYMIKDNIRNQYSTVHITDDTHVDIAIPNPVNINITDNGQSYNGFVYFTRNLPNWDISSNCVNGKLSAALEEGETYFVMLSGVQSGIYNKVTVSNNMNLEFTDIKILSEGPGLTFPSHVNQEPISQKYLVGSTIRLYGIPMEGYRCEYWDINGISYDSDMIEYQINDKTTATAYFIETTSTNIKGTNISDINIHIADGHLYFPEKIEGDVNIYTTNGNLVKSVFVVSNQMRIDDLKPGIYIVSIKTNQNFYSAKFSIDE